MYLHFFNDVPYLSHDQESPTRRYLHNPIGNTKSILNSGF